MGDRQPRLDFFRIGERIGSEIVRARKAHPDRGWVMGKLRGVRRHDRPPHRAPRPLGVQRGLRGEGAGLGRALTVEAGGRTLLETDARGA